MPPAVEAHRLNQWTARDDGGFYCTTKNTALYFDINIINSVDPCAPCSNPMA